MVHREVGWMRNCPSGVSFLLIRGVSCNDTMTTLVFPTNSSSLSLLFPVNIYTKPINHNVSIRSLPHCLPLPPHTNQSLTPFSPHPPPPHPQSSPHSLSHSPPTTLAVNQVSHQANPAATPPNSVSRASVSSFLVLFPTTPTM